MSQIKEELSFEEAVKKLEEIVSDLESDELSLEELLEKFEEGIRLSRLCSQKLDKAEQKIKLLLKSKEGRAEFKVLDMRSLYDVKNND